MTDLGSDRASLADRARSFATGERVIAVHLLGTTAVYAFSEEALFVVPPAGEPRRLSVHAGAILATAADGARVLTAGDDGKVVSVTADAEHRTVVTDRRRRWIDHVAVGPAGAMAWSAGKTAYFQSPKGEERALDVPSTVGGLAFAPRGVRLAVSHYNGVTLWFPNAVGAPPEVLEWRGSHLEVGFSPDGRFLVTAMQEPMLHGWRLADRRHMRMSGYSAKVRCLAWTGSGNWLATSGARQLILWPFQSRDGPMGKTPRLCAPHEALVTLVACHPTREIVAVGYEDGLVVLARIEDGAEIVARRPGAAPIAALAWNAAGTMLAFAAEDGEAGTLALS